MVTIEGSSSKKTNPNSNPIYDIWSALANNSYSFEQALNAVDEAERSAKKPEQLETKQPEQRKDDFSLDYVDLIDSSYLPEQKEQPAETPEKKSAEPEVFDTFKVAPGIDRDAEFKSLTGEDWPGVNYYAESNGGDDDGYDYPIETWTIYRRVQEQPSGRSTNTKPEPVSPRPPVPPVPPVPPQPLVLEHTPPTPPTPPQSPILEQTPSQARAQEQSPVPPEVQSQIGNPSPEERRVENTPNLVTSEQHPQPARQPEQTKPDKPQWDPRLSEIQIDDLVERGIYEPEGPEYEQALLEFGLKPIARAAEAKPDKPQWDPKLSQEQIEDLIERGIYEPTGPEYEQALAEMVGLRSLSKDDQKPNGAPATGNYFKPATDIEPEPIITVEAYPNKGGKDSEASAKAAETAETAEEAEEERMLNEAAEYFKDGFKPEMVEDENGKFSKEKHRKFTEYIKGFVNRIGNKVKSIRERRYKIAVRKKEIEQRLAKIKGNYSTPEQNPAPVTHEDNSNSSAPETTAPNFKPAGDLDDKEDASSDQAEVKDIEDDEIEDSEDSNEASQNFEESDAYEEYVNKEFKDLGENTIEFLTSTRPLDKVYAGQIFNWWTPAEPLNDEARDRIKDLLIRSRGLPEGSAVRELFKKLKIIKFED